jgi:hypothetical protein
MNRQGSAQHRRCPDAERTPARAGDVPAAASGVELAALKAYRASRIRQRATKAEVGSLVGRRGNYQRLTTCYMP